MYSQSDAYEEAIPLSGFKMPSSPSKRHIVTQADVQTSEYENFGVIAC